MFPEAKPRGTLRVEGRTLRGPLTRDTFSSNQKTYLSLGGITMEI